MSLRFGPRVESLLLCLDVWTHTCTVLDDILYNDSNSVYLRSVTPSPAEGALFLYVTINFTVLNLVHMWPVELRESTRGTL